MAVVQESEIDIFKTADCIMMYLLSGMCETAIQQKEE